VVLRADPSNTDVHLASEGRTTTLPHVFATSLQDATPRRTHEPSQQTFCEELTDIADGYIGAHYVDANGGTDE
jgi:hypothetical protein